jgi:sporulation protein YlmC with PRC-barrel domain
MTKIRVVPKTDDAGVRKGALVPMSDIPNYIIEDPSPDLRGWTVKLRDGRTVGKVDDLVVNTDTLTVEYMEVKLTREFQREEDSEWLLVPASAAGIDEQHDVVTVDRLPAKGLDAVPRSRTGDETRRALTAADGRTLNELFEIGAPETDLVIDDVASERPLDIP